MIADLKPYPAMKASGQQWLGQVPAHWDVLPNRAMLVEANERGHPDERMLSVTIASGVIPQDALLADSAKKDSSNQDKSPYKLVRPGDIAYNKMRAWQGAIGVSDETGIVSPAYVVQRPRAGVNSRYLHYLFRTPAFAKEAERWSYGITSDMWSLRPEHFRMIYACLPPAAEQTAIVRFLDYIDRRIRRYIRAKQKLIKLLEEQKQAIIQRAVTRGVDPSLPLKASGVSWLGDIPRHWDVVRSRRLFSARKQLALPGDVQLSATQMYGVIPQEEFERRIARRVVKISMHLDRRKHVERDDFVISMRSFQGGLERAWASGAIRSSYVVLNPAANVDIDFFAYLFKSHGYIGALQATSNFIRDGQDLTEANFRQVDLPLIPLKEQARIASYISKAIAGSVREAARLRREIKLLQEYHIRLIFDVVTGKLDVRAIVACLPGDTDQSEEVDDTDLLGRLEEVNDAGTDTVALEVEA